MNSPYPGDTAALHGSGAEWREQRVFRQGRGERPRRHGRYGRGGGSLPQRLLQQLCSGNVLCRQRRNELRRFLLFRPECSCRQDADAHRYDDGKTLLFHQLRPLAAELPEGCFHACITRSVFPYSAVPPDELCMLRALKSYVCEQPYMTANCVEFCHQRKNIHQIK